MNPQGRKTHDGVIELTRELIADARAEAEQRSRSPLGAFSRLLLVLASVATLSAVVTTVYGIGWLPADIPIRKSGNSYVTKRGEPQTIEMFNRYTIWSAAMFVAYPASIALWFIFAAVRKRDER